LILVEQRRIFREPVDVDPLGGRPRLLKGELRFAITIRTGGTQNEDSNLGHVFSPYHSSSGAMQGLYNDQNRRWSAVFARRLSALLSRALLVNEGNPFSCSLVLDIWKRKKSP
jgi:hypothetical protein